MEITDSTEELLKRLWVQLLINWLVFFLVVFGLIDRANK